MPSFIRRPHALLLVLAGLAQAEPPQSQPAPELSALSMAVLVGGCVSCHGPGGRSSTSIPSIAGQPESRLYQRLQAFKQDSGHDATIMPRLIKGYDDSQIQALAHWFSQAK